MTERRERRMLTLHQPPTSKHPETLPFHLLYLLGINTKFCFMKILFFFPKMFEKNKNRRYKIFITFTCKDMIMNTLNHIECWHNPNRPYLKPHKCLFLFSSFPNIAFPHPPAFLKKKVLRLKTWMIRLKIQPCCFIAFLLWQVNLSLHESLLLCV